MPKRVANALRPRRALASTSSHWMLLVAAFLLLWTTSGCGDGDGSGDTNCGGDDCLTPPPAECADGVLLTFSAFGTCDADSNRCTYPVTQRTCPNGCENAACLAPPVPCEGVTCDTPPAASCEGTIAVRFENAGTCADGTCTYPRVRTNCADQGAVCLGGACVSPCDGETCTSPPAATCEENVALVPAATGTCTSGLCDYPITAIDCLASGQLCQDGACVEAAACAGLDCTTIPQPWCDRFFAVTATGAGTCNPVEASCDYPTSRTNCAVLNRACLDGACVEIDPCEGVSCTTLPPDGCDGNTALVYTTGTCANAVCAFVPAETDCAATGEFCLQGSCVDADPCLAVTCNTPPGPRCEGTRIITSAATGTCAAGLCAYAETQLDCGASGQFCSEGTCVASDPCVGVTCDLPPPDTCDGEVAVVANPAGTCTSGLCSYATNRISCAALGQFCSEGACVTVDPCLTATCDAPPAPACEGVLAVTYAAGGTCSGGACRYAATRVNCAALGGFCDAGTCQLPDACTGVACDRPPAATCDGDTAMGYEEEGTCAAGRCSYSRVATNCAADGGYCFNGVCLSIDTCTGVACDTPPRDTCDGQTAVVYQSAGRCTDGNCSYDQVRTNCAASGQFCFGAACVAQDPCTGVTCTTPPAATCDGNDVVRAGAGSCAGGTCSYATTRETCVDGALCFDGGCETVDPCTGITCNAPPAATCEGRTAVVPEPLGICTAGNCAYGAARLDCAATGQFCANGACVATDPCIGVACNVPPTDTCDGDDALRYSASGTCAGGTCSYLPVVQDCAALTGYCFQGTCVDTDRCDDVSCETPPVDFCDGAVAVAWEELGGCRAGTCLYDSTRTNCSATGLFCDQGRCVATDPCLGLACNTLPPAFCDADTVVRSVAAGCENSTCLTRTERQDCGLTNQYCAAGTCVDIDPCLGVSCTTPPTATCQGQVARRSTAPGTCADGRCDYPVQTTDCGALGQFCSAGVCVATNPCTGVACNTPPAAVCDGDTAVAFGSGACAGGTCSYTSTRTNCAADGGFCRDGRCEGTGLCTGVVCNQRPHDVCVDGVSIRYAAGVCGQGTCSYASTTQDCRAQGQFCSDGLCRAEDPCDTLVCDTPPAPVCDGNTAVVAVETGTCEDGDCSFETTRIDCAGQGQFCQSGACIDQDPCLGTLCNTPPQATCRGNTAVRPATTGTCEVGVCAYAEAEVNCAALGQFCSAGACVVADPCQGVSCPTAPSVCDGDTLLVARTGACVAGVCEQSYDREACDAVVGGACVDGACLTFDPCEGRVCNRPPGPTCEGDGLRVYVSGNGICDGGECLYGSTLLACDAAPSATCDGDTAVRFAADGTCADGACAYASTRTDCAASGQFCAAGVCTNIDPCLGVSCTTPQPAFCDAQTAVTYASVGTCTAGSCQYTQTQTNCAATGRFCNAGACVTVNPCAGVRCDIAPANACDGNTALQYSGLGTCSEGRCTYTPTPVACAAVPGGFCLDGACLVQDPCTGILCNTPPAAVCDGNAVVRPTGDGTCALGNCTYGSTRVPCNLPPADSCDGDVAVDYPAGGGCADGACVYTPVRTDCAARGEFCQAGRCVAADPCLGLNCNAPPSGTCLGTVALSSIVPGTCAAGVCTYTPRAVDCADAGQFCSQGACVAANPCAGITCNTPPAPVCDGNLARTWTGSGVCQDGTCSYEATATNCAATANGACQDGACITVDPCLGVACTVPPTPICEGNQRRVYAPSGTCTGGTCAFASSVQPCNTPPVNACDGDTAVRYTGTATCNGGQCSYAATRVACRELGEFCFEGACVALDPCEGITCGPTPAPACVGNTAVTSSGAGTCDGGICRYAQTQSNCTALGQFCLNGACTATDPCAGVTCPTDGGPLCDGDQAVTPLPGVCAAGICTPRSTQIDCGALTGICSDGACVGTALCDGVTCTAPPATCTNGVATRYDAGDCRLGTCSFEDTQTDCRALGQFCLEGACVATDPCLTTLCDDPPSAVCDGNFAVLPTAGTCTDGACDYGTARVDCGATGQFCFAGACTTADPCVGRVCNAAPGPRCEANLAVSFIEPGTCEAGTCNYARATIDCAARGEFCNAGACSTVNPCQGIACSTPPAAVCDGDTAVTFQTSGTCQGGTCSYGQNREPCNATPGGYCVGGACATRDPCAGVACDNPPAPVCSGQSNRTVFSNAGTCTLGTCSYTSTVVPCNTPPPATCDGQTSVSFTPAGSCFQGVCSYQESRTNCQSLGQFCSQGTCQTSDPCQGVSCTNPPPSFCDGETAVAYAAGTCDDGACSYTPVSTNCTALGRFCSAGVCSLVNPCIGVTCPAPPAATCNGDVRIGFAPGVCAGGTCTWAQQPENCAAVAGGFCVDGACLVRDPCQGVSCNNPPAAACDGNLVVTYQAAGTCALGACSYTSSVATCANPPADACDGDVAVRFQTAGGCFAGACVYGNTRTNCAATGQFCQAGACVDADPCEGLACTIPPAGTCNDRVANNWTVPGTCDRGTCSFAPTTTNCAATGRWCLDGVCVATDPCLTTTCLPNAPTCDGNTAVVQSVAGCSAGVCAFTDDRTNCAASPFGRCEAGACLTDNPCQDVVCDSPPAATCDGNRVRRYEASGTCGGGVCTYPSFLASCDAPPAPACDADVAVRWSPAGTCAAGNCSYGEVRIDCTARGEYCFDGDCQFDDPCAGVVCDTPPTGTCEGNVATRYAATAECDGGGCDYDEIEEDCDETSTFCFTGVCQTEDPCAAVACDEPPDAFCDGTTLISFPAIGACEYAVCTYDEVPVNCAADGGVCFEGACVPPDRCEGVLCEQPPPRICDGQQSVRFANQGTCSDADGLCDYAEASRTDCTIVPAPRCATPSVIDGFSAGVCNGGFCSFNVTQTTCGAGTTCFEGACLVGEPCDYLICTPPAPSCEGDVAVTYSTANACVDGRCRYSDFVVRTNCASGGGTCVDGGCVSPPTPIAGDLVITEFATAGPQGWFEVSATTTFSLNLSGVVLQTQSGASFTLPAGTRLSAGDVLVIGGSSSVPGGPDVAWTAASAVALVRPGSVTLRSGATVVAQLEWTAAWPGSASIAAQLDPDIGKIAPTEIGSWCAATSQLTPTTTGTPGAANPPCDAIALQGPRPGDVVVTELVHTPAGGVNHQWFEIQNVSTRTVEVGGMQIVAASGGSVTVPASTRLLPSAALVVARPAAVLSDRLQILRQSTITIQPVDTVTLSRAGVTIDTMAWRNDGAWPNPVGASLAFDTRFAATQRSNPAWWCAGTTVQTTDDGTPGRENDGCTYPCASDASCVVPVPACSGNQTVTFAPVVCEDSVCAYGEARTAVTCDAPTPICEAGSCLAE